MSPASDTHIPSYKTCEFKSNNKTQIYKRHTNEQEVQQKMVKSLIGKINQNHNKRAVVYLMYLACVTARGL